jgi:transcriptional regulator with XRE-family HTH domain
MNAYTATRAHYRLSQDQWARAFGVARTTISAWESGEAHPPPVAVGAYRKLQEHLRRGDYAAVESTRAQLLAIADQAERAADRLNRSRLEEPSLGKVIAVSAAAVAIGMLLAYLFEDEKP